MKLVRNIYLSIVIALAPFWCLAQRLESEELRFVPMPNVNTGSFEYAQGLIGENVLLVRPAVDGTARDQLTDAFYFDLYQWDPVDNRLSLLPYTLNTDAHEGSGAWSEATQELFFSRNSSRHNRERSDKAGIYIWPNGQDTVYPFPYNKNGSIVCHPTLSADGKLMVFSADFPEGYGGMDLYYSVRNDSAWTKPINLGPAINTAGNEVFPFLHRSETLFYSSSGSGGEGGLDLLYSTPLSGVWQRPERLPAPFNSPADDFGLWLNPLGTAGFMNSNRSESLGGDDVYQFESGTPIFIPASDWHDIEVLDKQSMQPVGDAMVALQFNQAWNHPYKKRKNAAAEARKPWQQSRFYTDSSGMTRCPVNENLWLQVYVQHPDYRESVEIMRFDRDNLWHQILLEKKCQLLTGSVQSSDRPEGIPNITVDLLNDQEEILESHLTDSTGMFTLCLRADSSYRFRFSGEGWVTLNAPVLDMPEYAIHKKWYLEELPAEARKVILPDGPIVKGSIFVFDQIYYDYNDSEIRQDATAELDALIVKMNELPNMRIELIAHTDARGNEEYNLLLSVERAEAARKYLIKKGIAAGRIRAVGYGEYQLRNHCKDGVECSEDEHAYNRRTEIKVLSLE